MSAGHIGRTIRVPIAQGDPPVVFIVRRPTGQQISKFMGSRWETRRNKVKTNLYPAREAFFDEIAIDCEGVTFDSVSGGPVELNSKTVLGEDDKREWSGILGTKVETWKDLIPLEWKSALALHFERAEAFAQSGGVDEDEDGGEAKGDGQGN